MPDLIAAARGRAGACVAAIVILLCFTFTTGAQADPPTAPAGGGTAASFQDLLRGLIDQVAATNDYKPFTILTGADDATVAGLVKLLQDPQLTPRQRFVTAVALSYVRTAAARTALLTNPPDQSPLVRQGVALALGYFRDDTGEVQTTLSQLAANDPWTYTDPKTGVTHYLVRETAARSLTRLAQAQPLATPATTPPVIPVYAARPTPTPTVPATKAATAPATTPTTATNPTLPVAAVWALIAPPASDLPPCLSALEVSGTWEKTPESAGQLTIASDGRLTFEVPDAGLVTARRTEPLPDGPWTLNLWRSTKTIFPEDQLTLTFGNPGHAVVVELTTGKWNAAVHVRLLEGNAERNQRLLVLHARGPVQWLQLSYTPQKTIAVRLNGVAMPAWQLGPVEMPVAPITLAGHSEKATAIQVASFTVGPYDPIVQPAEGLLNGGWSTPPHKLAPADAEALTQKLQGFAADASLAPPAHMYALAALALLQSAQTGQVSDALWQQLLFEQGGQVAQAWAVQTLPLLLACASPAQRQAAAPVVKYATSQINSAANGANVSRQDIKLRAGLFAPQTLAQMMSNSSHDIDQPRLTLWLETVMKSDPCTGFTLWNSMPTNFNDPRFQAWLSGRVRTLLPNYSRLLLENHLSEAPFVADDARCRAALEIARTDRPAALRLFAQMQTSSYRELAAAALGVETTTVLTPMVAAATERNLRNNVAQWQPSRQEHTPVKPMLKLAEFLKQEGKTVEAAATLRDMAAKVSAQTPPDCREVEIVATGMDDLQLPEAATWIDKASAAAQAQDGGQNEPDPGSGEAYLSATWHLVHWFLLPRGMTDRALALAQSLDPQRMTMNYNNIIINVLNACAETKPERVAELLPKLVDEERISRIDRQVQVIAKLCDTPALAAGTWPEQWINLLPPDKRFPLVVKLAVARGKPLTGDLQEQFGQMLTAELKYTKTRRGNGWSNRGWALHQLEPLTLAQLQQYERFLKDDPDLYCYQLLNTLVRETGLVNDPFWRLWKAPDQETAYQLPWELQGEQLKDLGSAAAQ